MGALGNIALTAGLLVMAGVLIAGFATITGLAATIGAVATSGYAFGNALYYAAEEKRTTGSVSADTKLDLVEKGAEMMLALDGGIKYAQSLETAAAAERTAAEGVKESAPVENPETGLKEASPNTGKGYEVKGYNPKQGERTFQGYVNDNVSQEAEVSLYTYCLRGLIVLVMGAGNLSALVLYRGDME